MVFKQYSMQQYATAAEVAVVAALFRSSSLVAAVVEAVVMK